MERGLRLFAARLPVLEVIRLSAPAARVFALTPGGGVLAMPLDDDLHDALRRDYGTGEWLESGVQLTTGDLARCAGASRKGPIGYVEMDDFPAGAGQAAVLWDGGVMLTGPVRLEAAAATARPAHLWPVNAVLRGLGIRAAAGADEIAAFGLARFPSNAAIIAGAFEIAPPRGRR